MSIEPRKHTWMKAPVVKGADSEARGEKVRINFLPTIGNRAITQGADSLRLAGSRQGYIGPNSSHGGKVVQRRMPDRVTIENIRRKEESIQEIELDTAIRALAVALRAGGHDGAAASVRDDVEQLRIGLVGDGPTSALDRVIDYLITQSELYDLFLPGAAALDEKQQPDASERIWLGYAVSLASETLAEIGNGFSGKAQGDPVANVFGKGADDARPIFTLAAQELRRLYDEKQIFKRRQGAPGLTNPSSMVLSLDFMAALQTNPAGWRSQKTLCHEAFHIVDSNIQDRGGYRPPTGGEHNVLFSRPVDVMMRSVSHFEEVVWQYTGNGLFREAGVGGASGPKLLAQAQDMVQGAWWASLDAKNALVDARRSDASEDVIKRKSA